MRTALCIVDMQPSFRASALCLDAVLREIKLAKKRKALIVLLEYEEEEPSYKKILDSLADYRDVCYYTKDEDDGSSHVLRAIEGKTKRVRVVGVNGCWCVDETARSLMDLGFDVQTPKEAIACECKREKCSIFEEMDYE